jgi:rsbT co-antagonist protein RsbR
MPPMGESMLKSIFDKITYIHLSDPLSLRQAKILQTSITILFIVGFLDFLYLLFLLISNQTHAFELAILLGFLAILGFSLYLLHLGKLFATIITLSLSLLLVLTIVFLSESLIGKEVFLMAFIIPIVLTGLLLDQRWLMYFTLLSVISITVVGLNELQALPIERRDLKSQLYTDIFAFSLICFAIAGIVDRFGNTLQSTLKLQQQRERELEQLSQSLEVTVREQTADLRVALQQSEQREQELRNALQQIDKQRTTIRQLSVPIIPVSEHAMVMPLVGELDQDRLDIMTQQALNEMAQQQKSRLIIDLTGVTMFDNKVAECLLDMIEAVRLMGSETVIVGVRPELAQSIVATGTLSVNLHTERSLQALLS